MTDYTIEQDRRVRIPVEIDPQGGMGSGHYKFVAQVANQTIVSQKIDGPREGGTIDWDMSTENIPIGGPYPIRIATIDSYQPIDEAEDFADLGTLTIYARGQAPPETPQPAPRTGAAQVTEVAHGAYYAFTTRDWQSIKTMMSLELFAHELLHHPRRVFHLDAIEQQYMNLLQGAQQLLQSQPQASSWPDYQEYVQYINEAHTLISTLRRDYMDRQKKSRRIAMFDLFTIDPNLVVRGKIRGDTNEKYWDLKATELGGYLRDTRKNLNMSTAFSKALRPKREDFNSLVEALYNKYYLNLYEHLTRAADILDRLGGTPAGAGPPGGPPSPPPPSPTSPPRAPGPIPEPEPAPIQPEEAAPPTSTQTSSPAETPAATLTVEAEGQHPILTLTPINCSPRDPMEIISTYVQGAQNVIEIGPDHSNDIVLANVQGSADKTLAAIQFVEGRGFVLFKVSNGAHLKVNGQEINENVIIIDKHFRTIDINGYSFEIIVSAIATLTITQEEFNRRFLNKTLALDR